MKEVSFKELKDLSDSQVANAIANTVAYAYGHGLTRGFLYGAVASALFFLVAIAIKRFA